MCTVECDDFRYSSAARITSNSSIAKEYNAMRRSNGLRQLAQLHIVLLCKIAKRK